MRMTDEALDHYGELYVRNAIGAKLPGVTFERFLADPHGYLQAACFNLPLPTDDAALYPLLPRQAEIHGALYQEELIEEIEERLLNRSTRHCGSGYVEPLKHHRYETTRHRDARRIPR